MVSSKAKPQTLKGFRDFLPEEMRVRNFVLGVMREVFEEFGFEPLETPSLEYTSTLLGKYGNEADRLVYTFADRGDREVGLIYDLTIPVSRVLAEYGEQIPKPFKRYQIQRVWRAEKPQKGRYREFTQCDFDIFGVESALADAETIAVTYNILRSLAPKNFVIKINSRPLLISTLEELGITEKSQQLAVLRIIDKLDKKPKQEVIGELKKINLSYLDCDSMLNKIKSIRPDKNIKKILDYLKAFGLEQKYYKFDPTLVRGLDYYTGPIFEAVVDGYKGSVAGGGRYDNLIEQLGGPPTPATGTSLGLDRIVEIIIERSSKDWLNQGKTEGLVTIFDEALTNKSLELFTILRSMGIRTEIYPDGAAKLNKQIKYANRKGIGYVLILGPEEVENKTVTIKNLKTGEQETVGRDKIVEYLKSQMSKLKTTC